jgi:hypothetical protein
MTLAELMAARGPLPISLPVPVIGQPLGAATVYAANAAYDFRTLAWYIIGSPKPAKRDSDLGIA